MPTYHVIETYERVITVEASSKEEAFEKVEQTPLTINVFDELEFIESTAILQE